MSIKDKLMSKKVKGIPVFAVAFVLVAGIGSAALVSHFAQVGTTVHVKPAVKIDSITWEGSNVDLSDNGDCTWVSDEHTEVTCDGLSGVQQGEGAAFEVHVTNEADDKISAVGKFTWDRKNSADDNDADDFQTFKVKEGDNPWWNLGDEISGDLLDESGNDLVMYYGTENDYVSTGDSTFDFEVELADAIETGDYDLTFKIVPVSELPN